jgi:hypothetical protein
MKHILLAALLLAPVAALCAETSKADADTKTLRVFIFAGQSNMEGGDSKAKDIKRFPPFAGLDAPQEKVLFSYYGKNLKNFLAAWRRDLKTPNLKFYIGELCTKTIWGMDTGATL